MGQLRSSARALLLTGAQPALLLEQLDAAASLIPDAYCTTVFLAILDTETGILQYSNAGHMPAVLAGAGSGSGTTLLTEAGSVPLAVRRDESRPQATQVLSPGSTLMLYTDGLVERRHESIDDGIARVGRCFGRRRGNCLSTPSRTRCCVSWPRQAGYDDDVAMVIYRHQQAPLRIESSATADKLAGIRRRLTGWLHAAGVPDELAADIVLVVNEACTNSVEHAYLGQDAGTMMVKVEAAESELHVRIGDFGSWQNPAAEPGNGGRGLLLMKALSDSVAVNCTPEGTTVDIGFRL